jgi:hypothetical protein
MPFHRLFLLARELRPFLRLHAKRLQLRRTPARQLLGNLRLLVLIAFGK